MKIYSLITFAFLLIHSCKKDRGIVNIESGAFCTEVPDSLSPYQPGPPPTPFLGFTHKFPKTNFRFPCFNPQDATEFVYVKTVRVTTSIANNETIDELRIFNLNTRTSRSILNNVKVEMPLVWGYDGWIYFTHGILPKRCDVTTLEVQTLSAAGYGGSALSSPDGQFYVIRNIVWNQQNQPVDTLPSTCHSADTWSVDGSIYSAGGNPKSFIKMSVEQGTVTRTRIPEFDIYTHDIMVNPFDGNDRVYASGSIQIPNTDHFIIPLTRHGNIWLYDESDSTCVVFKQGAYDSFFNGFSVSNDSNKILASFHREVPTDYSRIVFNVYEKIYIMDINGCNMEEVVLE